jgi:diguanylate cyclase (GGDEF)-like protein/PAS domain S-box-containing protein
MEKPAKILVVDDDPDLLELTSFILNKEGYEVFQASSGEESLYIARSERPDLVIMDVVLRDMSGLEACRKIKEDKELQGTYVVLLSGIKTSSNSQAEGLRAGADGYIVRPIPNRELLARIDAMIRIKRTESEIKAQREWFRVTLSSIGDGVIATDERGKVIFMNPVAQSLTGWSQKEAEGKQLSTVFRIIDETTRQPVRDPFERIMKEGSIYGIAHNTLLISRDQREIPIDYSGVSTKDDASNTVGVMLAFHDISERKAAEEALSWEAEVNTTIAELSSMLLAPVSIEDISSLVLEHAKRLTASVCGYVGYIDPQTGHLVCPTASEETGLHTNKTERGIVLEEISGKLGWALKNRQSLLLNQVDEETSLPGCLSSQKPISRLIASPAMIDGSLVGQIALANSHRPYEQRDLALIERLAALYAIAIHRKRAEEELRSLSLVDDLTGLYNRRGFLTLAEQQLKVAHRMKKGMLLLFADLDKMKWINDTLGHREGDSALIYAANIFKNTFRESDIIARIGGDEFVILALETSESDIGTITNRLEEALRSHNQKNRRPYSLSISMGVARYNPLSPRSIEELLDEADQRMYEQKRSKDVS